MPGARKGEQCLDTYLGTVVAAVECRTLCNPRGRQPPLYLLEAQPQAGTVRTARFRIESSTRVSKSSRNAVRSCMYCTVLISRLSELVYHTSVVADTVLFPRHDVVYSRCEIALMSARTKCCMKRHLVSQLIGSWEWPTVSKGVFRNAGLVGFLNAFPMEIDHGKLSFEDCLPTDWLDDDLRGRQTLLPASKKNRLGKINTRPRLVL